MCSRVLGLVREQVFASFFGAGFAFDAFVVAFRIPNLLRDLFAEGALSAAFVTVFSDHETNKGERATWELAGNVLVFLSILLSGITLLGMLFSDRIVGFMVEAEFKAIAGKVALTSLLSAIMFPFLLFVSLASVVMGILNTRGRFFVPAMASAFFNLGSIIGGLGFSWLMPYFGQQPIVGMAIGTLIGGLLQLVYQLPALFKVGFVFIPRLDLADPGLRRILRLMAPAVIGLAPMQVNVLINTYFASSLAEGSLSWLSYAFRLFWLPVGIFGVALSTAALPVIARYAALKDMDKLRETYASSLILTLSLTIPAAVGLILLGEPITRVIFQHGHFSALDTARTAEALACYAVGLFAYSSIKIMVPVFYALDKTKFPVMGSFLTMAVNVVLVWLTIDLLQHRALALSISCAMILNFLFLSVALYKKLGGYSLRYLFSGLGKIICAALAMAVWVYGFQHVSANLDLKGLLANMAMLAAAIATGGAVYGITLYALGFKELTVLVERVRQRFGWGV